MQNQVQLSSEINVKLIRCMASDDMVVQAAQVSVKGENNPETDSPRLINYLMSSRHGSPFEHNSFTFFAEAPIFVFREWWRHRMSSINEYSARYSEMKPKFYTPDTNRKMVNAGTSARPEMVAGTSTQKDIVYEGDRKVAEVAWEEYQKRIASGISKEVARSCLGVNIYSQAYWTVNARSLMNFISLRVDSPDAKNRTRPQWEIQVAAEKVEEAFAEHMPVSYAAFVANGRVAP
jgi:thymidylate synthase (FAD)